MSEEKKPSQFDIISGLNATFKEEMANPTDLIMEKAKQSGILPGRQRPVGDKLDFDKALPPIAPLEVNGFKLQRTNIPQMDALTVLMFIMATEFAKNPKIRRILNQIQFQFKDLEGRSIFPVLDEPVKAKTKKKRRK